MALRVVDHPLQNRFLSLMSTPLSPELSLGTYILDFVPHPVFARTSQQAGEIFRKAERETERVLSGNHPQDMAIVQKTVASAVPENGTVNAVVEKIFRQLPLGDWKPNYARIFEGEYNETLLEEDPKVKELRLSKLLTNLVYRHRPPVPCDELLEKLKETLREFRSSLGLDESVYLQGPDELTTRAAALKISRRLHTIAQRNLPASQPLRALHENQRRSAEALGVRAIHLFNRAVVDFRHAPLSFHRFLAAEEALIHHHIDRDLDDSLRALWQQIKRQIPNAGPWEHALAQQIRIWMNDPANEETLQQVDYLNFGGGVFLRAIPPEIGKLTALRGIYLDGINRNGLRGLPDEMRNLRVLEYLYLQQGHSFREIPPVINQLPQLRSLRISGPISVLSDEIWQRFFVPVTLGTHFWRFFRPNDGDLEMDSMFLGIDPGNLTEMPFELWARSHLRIPYIQIMPYCGPSSTLSQFLGSLPLAARCLVETFFFIPFLVGWLIIQPLLNLPAFLTNLFFVYVAIPFLTEIRDEIGYDRMVRA